jgi:hypothetical protein
VDSDGMGNPPPLALVAIALAHLLLVSPTCPYS